MTFSELSWAAGLFEGEGSVIFASTNKPGRRRHLSCKLTTTDEDVLTRFRDVVGVGRIYGPRQVGDYKPHWDWTTTRFEEAQAVIAFFWKWLGSRRKATAKAALTGYLSVQAEPRRKHKFTWAERCTQHEYDAIVAMHASGVSQKEIARMHGRSQSSVSRLLRGDRKVAVTI